MNYLFQLDASHDPNHLMSLVPWQGPFHISFNAQQNVVKMYRFLFEPLYKSIFGQRKVLAKKPKPFRISTLITACFGGWLLIRNTVLQHFGVKYKCVEYNMLVFILEEVVPLVYHFYPVILRGGDYQCYKKALYRMAVLFIIHRRRHYDKATLCQLSDMIYHDSINLMNNVHKTTVNIFTEKKVEIFHSILRR